MLKPSVSTRCPIWLGASRPAFVFFSYFRRFAPNFSRIAAPLLNQLKKDKKFFFDPECLDAFNKLRDLLIAAPVLAIYNPTRETELHTDASSQGFAKTARRKVPSRVSLLSPRHASWIPLSQLQVRSIGCHLRSASLLRFYASTWKESRSRFLPIALLWHWLCPSALLAVVSAVGPWSSNSIIRITRFHTVLAPVWAMLTLWAVIYSVFPWPLMRLICNCWLHGDVTSS